VPFPHTSDGSSEVIDSVVAGGVEDEPAPDTDIRRCLGCPLKFLRFGQNASRSGATRPAFRFSESLRSLYLLVPINSSPHRHPRPVTFV